MSAYLFVPIGPPGCGKSTFAMQLIANGHLPGTAVVSPDHYREVITGDRANQDANGAVFQVCGLIAQARLSRGLPVYWDATNLKPSSWAQLDALVGNTLAKRVNIVFHATWPELVERNNTRHHPVPEDVLVRMHKDYIAMPSKSLLAPTITVDEARKFFEGGHFA